MYTIISIDNGAKEPISQHYTKAGAEFEMEMLAAAGFSVELEKNNDIKVNLYLAIYICIIVMMLGVAITSYVMNYRNTVLQEENDALKSAEKRTCIINQGGIPVHWRNCKVINDQYATTK